MFIAADPPLELAEELAAWARAQRVGTWGVRVIVPESIHLTMAFLGERPLDEVETIAAAAASAVQQVEFGAISGLRIGEPLLLPPRTPRVLSATVEDPSGHLLTLRKALAAELLEAIGWSERRSFKPHMTLARIAREGRLARRLAPLPSGEFGFTELVLYRSHLETAAARYEAVARIALN